MAKTNILGINFDNVTLTESVEKVSELIGSNPKDTNKRGSYVVTPNPEFVMRARADTEFARILNEADLSIPDGVGVVWASRLLGKNLRARVTGVDLVNELLKVGSNKRWNFFFLGASEGVAKEAANKVLQRYPGLLVGHYSGGGAEDSEKKVSVILKDYARKFGVIDVLLVAYGQVKQEKWIDRNLSSTPARLAIGVGSVLDYLSETKKRAPLFMQVLGLEWLFRLMYEPWRVKRQLALPKFALLVLKEKLLS